MPLTILGVALLGWWVAGLAPAVALLLGAVLAPTDPVLASDVQVGEPLTEDVDEPERGGAREPRRGRRHPFLADGRGGPQRRPRLPVRAPGPAAHRRRLHARRRRHLDRLVRRGQDRPGHRHRHRRSGWLLGRQAFHSRSDNLRLADHGEPLLALAALLTAYGAAELVGGYGFLAVFACAMRVRASERGHSYQRAMHAVVERLERLMTLLVLLVLGMAMTRGLLDHLDWRGIVVALGARAGGPSVRRLGLPRLPGPRRGPARAGSTAAR